MNFVGSSNLLGNPVSFIDSIGTGVKDFYYEPMNGFLKGGREGLIGLRRGTGSLVKNFVGGTLGSFGKITSSMSSGLLMLTSDD